MLSPEILYSQKQKLMMSFPIHTGGLIEYVRKGLSLKTYKRLPN